MTAFIESGTPHLSIITIGLSPSTVIDVELASID